MSISHIDPPESRPELEVPLPPSPSPSPSNASLESTVNYDSKPNGYAKEDHSYSREGHQGIEAPISGSAFTVQGQDRAVHPDPAPTNVVATPGPTIQTSTLATPSVNTAIENPSPLNITALMETLEDEAYEVEETAKVRRSLQELVFEMGRSRRSLHSLKRRYSGLARSFHKHALTDFEHQLDACQKEFPIAQSPQELDPISEAASGSNINSFRRLEQHHRSAILEVIADVRNDERSLSRCLIKMTPKELLAWSSSGSSDDAEESVLSLQSKSRNYNNPYIPKGRQSTISKGPRLFDLHHVIFHDLFDNGMSNERALRQRLWSCACADLLLSGKAGAEEFLHSTLSSFAMFEDWSIRARLDSFLLNVLQDGCFLLESGPRSIVDFTQPIEIQNASLATATSQFFDRSLRKLFQLLSEFSPTYGIPQPCLTFARAVARRLPQLKLKNRTNTQVVVRWYLSSLLAKVIMYPENAAMLLNHHIGESPRRLILKGLAVRLQQVATDISAPWRSDYAACPEISQHVDCIIRLLDGPEQCDPLGGSSMGPRAKNPNGLIHLHVAELVDLVEFFTPETSTQGDEGDQAPGPSSAAPSVTESSIATSESTEIPSLTPSSVAPSVSGTSMTSLTMTTDDLHYDAGQPQATGACKEDRISTNEERHKTGKDFSLVIREATRELQFLLNGQDHTALQWTEDHVVVLEILYDEKPMPYPSISLYFHGAEEAMEEIATDSTFNKFSHDAQILRESLLQLPKGNRTYHQINFRDPQVEPLDCTETLRARFAQQASASRICFDYQAEYFWWQAMELLDPTATTAAEGHIAEIVSCIHDRSRTRISESHRSRAWFGERIRSLQTILQSLDSAVRMVTHDVLGLRNKMWYVSDVKHSSHYEDALRVTQALQSMASAKEATKPSGSGSWARHRLRSGFGYQRAEVQVMEAMTAARDHGGPSRLADDQTELTSRWLTKNSIENLCRGEERIHRFCLELRKCIGKLVGTSTTENPTLWASKLFHNERQRLNRSPTRGGSHPADFQSRFNNQTKFDSISSSSAYIARTLPPIETSSFSFGERSSHNRAMPRSGAVVNIYQAQPRQMHDRAYISGSSLARTQVIGHDNYHDRDGNLNDFVDAVRISVKSLLLSDLGYTLWSKGSETDQWILMRMEQPPVRVLSTRLSAGDPSSCSQADTGSLNDTLSDSTITASQRLNPHASSPHHDGAAPLSHMETLKSSSADNLFQERTAPHGLFPFGDMYKEILQRFSASASPITKLDLLYELEALIYRSLSRQQTHDGGQEGPMYPQHPNTLLIRNSDVPRTKATSLEEVMANCNERRLGTLKSNPLAVKPKSPPFQLASATAASSSPGTDEVINVLLSLFKDREFRPVTLFRDLQIIAAFVPSEILDQTSKGKAFWDAAIAALAIKEDMCENLIKQANDITNYHLASRQADITEQPRDLSLAGTSLADAARLWITVAKEGSPVAARELGLLYLTHPDVLPRVTLPLSKTKDIFGSAMVSQDRNNSHDTKGLDPLTFAVVHHWMELAANGGDQVAKDFLKGVGELNTGR